MQSFDHLAILSQSNLIVLIAVGTGVPRQPMDCIDCDVIVDLHRDCRADRLEIALIWSRIVDYPGFWCNPLWFGNHITIQFDCEDCGQDWRLDMLVPSMAFGCNSQTTHLNCVRIGSIVPRSGMGYNAVACGVA